MRFKTLFYCFLCFWILQGHFPAHGWKPFKIMITYLNVTMNKQIGFANCWIHNDSAGHNVISGVFDMYQKLDSFMLRVSSRHARNDAIRPITISHLIDMCELYRKKRNMPQVVKAIVYEMLSRFDVPQKCPVEVGTYHIHEIGALEELVPSYVPLAAYKLSLHFFPQKRKTIRHVAWANFTVKLIPNSVKWNQRKG